MTNSVSAIAIVMVSAMLVVTAGVAVTVANDNDSDIPTGSVTVTIRLTTEATESPYLQHICEALIDDGGFTKDEGVPIFSKEMENMSCKSFQNYILGLFEGRSVIGCSIMPDSGDMSSHLKASPSWTVDYSEP